jgi:hypothetical protein
MSKKNKKQKNIKQKPAPTNTQPSKSVSFSKWLKRIVTTQPFALIIIVIFIGLAVFLLGGGIYSLTTEGIPTYWYYLNKFYFLSPFGMGEQFVTDTVISVMLYLMGFAGLLTIYQSTRSASKPRQAYMLLAVGISLVLLSYIFLESAISIKQAGIQ